MKKILIFDRIKDDHIKNWLSGLIRYFQNKNIEVHTSYGTYYNFHINYDLICIWNGCLDIYQPLINHAKKNNIKLLFLECGPISQKQYYYIDEFGVNADSSLMNDNLEWIDSCHYLALDKFRFEYLKGKRWNESNQYILCPLQISDDTNIVKHAPFKKMQDFIHHVEQKFSDENIVFKTHPVQCNLHYKVKDSNILLKNGSFIELAQHAKLVYGQTSTALLESTLMNVPTKAIGNCWLSKHKGNEERLLAALVDKQIPINETDLDYWFGKYLND